MGFDRLCAYIIKFRRLQEQLNYELKVSKLNDEYKAKCVVETSALTLMDDELTQQFCREVLGGFTFEERRLLAWDSFCCHQTQEIRAILNKGCIDLVIVAGVVPSLFKPPM